MFQIRREPTESIIQLLDKVTLGTDGAHYRHLDTREKIHEADSPLYYSLERNGRAIGNITLCERSNDWYLRYFAFDPMIQGAGKKRSKGSKENRLKKEVVSFLDRLFKGEFSEDPARSVYAYIDPKNQKSLWMSEAFGFKFARSVYTQSYSRVSPKRSERLVSDLSWDQLEDRIRAQYNNYSYFYPVQTGKGPFFGLVDENKELIACLKVTKAEWEISRLPGKAGGFLVKILPYIPVLNKLIRPKHHRFLVPDAIWVKDNDPATLNELLEGVLSAEGENLMLWWVDPSDDLYSAVQNKMKWGLIHKIIGINEAHLVVLGDENVLTETKSKPHFVSGFDFV